ncbi:chemotaxis protein CheW [Burkholderia ubonensis]|nr:chemotaxis protein CheW [Burkholderia ubonensis]
MEHPLTHHTIEAEERKFLVFKLGNEEYGIDILKTQEIRGYENVTHIVSMPDYIKGVINLRGDIVPIVDMRIRLNMSHAAYDSQTAVIILNVGRRVVGIVVDRVSDVLALSADQISPAPSFGLSMKTEYLMGLGTVEGRMLILVDIEKLMAGDELSMVQRAAA